MAKRILWMSRHKPHHRQIEALRELYGEDAVIERLGTGVIPAATVRSVLDEAASAVRESLSAGEPVFLFGLGKLSISQRGEKVARNIRTGETVIVPPRSVAVYRPSTSVDDAVNARVTAPSAD